MVNSLDTNEKIIVPALEIENLLKIYGREIFSYCYHLLRNKEDAEDAVQEIFLKAYDNLKKKQIDTISLWLYKVAYNHCLNILRKKKFKIQIAFDDNMFSNNLTPEEELENSEFSSPTQIALDRLSDLQKNILILRAVKSLDYEEISKITHKRPEAIRKNYERAKQKILKYLNTSKGVICNERTQNV